MEKTHVKCVAELGYVDAGYVTVMMTSGVVIEPLMQFSDLAAH